MQTCGESRSCSCNCGVIYVSHKCGEASVTMLFLCGDMCVMIWCSICGDVVLVMYVCCCGYVLAIVCVVTYLSHRDGAASVVMWCLWY